MTARRDGHQQQAINIMSNFHLSPAAAAAAQHLQRIKMAADEAAAKPLVDVRQLLLHVSGQEHMTFLEPGGVYDECIVGTAEIGGEIVAVYNKMAVIASMSRFDQISVEQAIDRFSAAFVARQGLPLVDAEGNKLPQSPVFVVDLRDVLA